jgi:hypothetical protein
VKQRLTLKYQHPTRNIGLNSWREVYLLGPILTQLIAEICRGKLIYRAKGSSRRFSYDQIKRGLVKRNMVVVEEVPNWFLV